MARVLVIDDDADIRAILAFTLEDAGHEVRHAADGETALAALGSWPAECVVLDLMMPVMDGYAVLRTRRDRKLVPSARVLVLSARTGDRDFFRAYELGADDYLTKPFRPSELAAKVQFLLDASREDLNQRREFERQKAELLARVESAFEPPPPA